MKPRYLADPLQQLTHAYRSHMRCAIQAAGIELPITYIRLLKGIASNAPCTAQSLSARMRRDKAQITRALNDLLAQGLISKSGNPQDRRSHWLQLTPSGETLMQRLLELESDTARHMSRGLDEEQLQTFIHLAQHMADNLNDHKE